MTIRIYTHNLQPNMGLKSSFALTIKMSRRCFFTGRATVVLLLQENKVRVLPGLFTQVWGETHNSFQRKMEIQSADYIELCCYTLFLYYHIKSSITISIGTVRLNSQAYRENDLPSRKQLLFLSVPLFHVFILII